MKRFSKIFSGIAAIMLGFGIMLIAFGFGSARADWQKIVGEEQGFDQVKRTFDGIDHLELDILFGYVKLGVSEDGKVHFNAFDIQEDNLEIKHKGDKLEICMEEGKNSRSTFSTLPYITVMGWEKKSDEFSAPKYELLLPKNYSGTLEVSLGTGVIEAEEIEAEGMEFLVDAGKLVVTECSAEKFKAECKFGDCVVDGVFEDIEIKSHVGIQRISLYGLKENYDGVISCNIGELDYHNPAHKERNFQEGFHLYEKWTGKAADGKLKIKCDIGQVTVMFEDSEISAVAQEMIPSDQDEWEVKDISEAFELPQDIMEIEDMEIEDTLAEISECIEDNITEMFECIEENIAEMFE